MADGSSPFVPMLDEQGRDKLNSFIDVQLDEAEDETGERPPSPIAVSEKRTTAALQQDRQLEAEITTDPAKYASDPDSFDFPGIDTPESVNGDFIEESPLTGQQLRFDNL